MSWMFFVAIDFTIKIWRHFLHCDEYQGMEIKSFFKPENFYSADYKKFPIQRECPIGFNDQ